MSPPSGTTQFALSATNRAGTIDGSFFIVVKQQQAPVFLTGDTQTCYVGTPCNIPVRATGWPTPAITESGILPEGVRFAPTARGAALSGQVQSSSARTYLISLRASTGVGPPATQTLRLSVR